MALRLTGKSLAILEKGETRNEKVNQGYAHLWLADIYVKKESFQEAFTHLARAYEIWNEYAPARIKKIRNHILEYPKKFFKKYSNERIIQELLSK